MKLADYVHLVSYVCVVCVHVCLIFYYRIHDFFIYEARDTESDSIKRSCVRASVRHHFAMCKKHTRRNRVKNRNKKKK